MILVFGSVNLDLVARVRRIPRPGETVLSPGYETGFGGKGANQAVAAARARRDTGLRVLMAGAVGEDAFGQAALDNFAANGVDARGVRRVGQPTGCAFITVDAAGENAITVASGANRAVSHTEVPDEWLAPGGIVVLQMEIRAAETLALARRARRRGARVLLNLAPAPGEGDGVPLADLLDATDILIANEHEALTAAALLGSPAGEDHEAAMASVATGRGLTGVVTLGARGAAAIRPDGTRHRAASLPVTPVDTTGAGDAFVGILAAGCAEGMPLAEALDRACIGASLACLTPGAQPGMPDAAAIEAARTRRG